MLKGKGVSTGVGFGNIVVLKKVERKIEKKTIENEQVEQELERLHEALNQVIDETETQMKNMSGTEADIMQAYVMIMQDPSLIPETENAIKNSHYNAEYAVEVGFNSVIQIFENMDDEYMASRARDILDIKNRVLGKLFKEENIDLSKLNPNTIIVATELTTSETAKLDFKHVSGIITELGGENSHTSIMARTHTIPAITKVEEATKIFKDGDSVAINGTSGEIYVNPTEEEKQKLLDLEKQLEEEKSELDKYRNQESVTKDGTKVKLYANIGIPADAEIAVNNTAEGVGLLRSEFLYMDSDTMPSEESQFEAYKKVAEIMKDKEAIIRTLDIGGDKELKYLTLEKEANPFLGYRAIRLCLDNPTIFKTQLRAILRASAFGKLAIMFPMISSIEELRAAKEVLEECKQELDNENILYDKNIQVGIMIEIPSAALIADKLAKECDFFSIGTNDLIQYTVAVERGNEKISKLYTKYHPAVIKLIKKAIDGAHSANIICGMCGEAAGDPTFIPLLVGLGLDEFSMNSNNILRARKTINNLDKETCVKLSEEILQMASAEEVEKRLGQFGTFLFGPFIKK